MLCVWRLTAQQLHIPFALPCGVYMSGLNIKAGNQEERWIRFQGLVNQKSGSALMRLADHFHGLGVRRVHLLINSLGGDVFAGPAAFNHFRMLRMPVFTYNVATVQSIAVPLFCVGTKRYCVPNATFMIHPVQWQANPGQVLTAQQLRENAAFCDTNTTIIADLIAAETGKTAESVRIDMDKTTNFDAAQAVAYGLVHEIVPVNFFPTTTSYTI